MKRPLTFDQIIEQRGIHTEAGVAPICIDITDDMLENGLGGTALLGQSRKRTKKKDQANKGQPVTRAR